MNFPPRAKPEAEKVFVNVSPRFCDLEQCEKLKEPLTTIDHGRSERLKELWSKRTGEGSTGHNLPSRFSPESFAWNYHVCSYAHCIEKLTNVLGSLPNEDSN